MAGCGPFGLRQLPHGQRNGLRATIRTSAEPGRRKAVRKEEAVTAATVEKDVAWAARQGTNDRRAGTECRKYKNFLRIYNLPRSQFTLRMWNAYLPARQPTPKSTARAGDRHDPLIPPDPPQNPSPAAVARKDPEWAARQGRDDRIAGKTCRNYETFLITYELHKSDASLHLWNTYHKQLKLAHRHTSPPKQKSRWTRGLTLSDTTTPRRKTVRRYDRVQPLKSDLSPENAALLMKVNQQYTLVDMVR